MIYSTLWSGEWSGGAYAVSPAIENKTSLIEFVHIAVYT
jgi:hypothetical protein